MDEIDDGFISPNNVASGGQSQAETRYIRAIIDQGLDLGLDGLVANASEIGLRRTAQHLRLRPDVPPRPDQTPKPCSKSTPVSSPMRKPRVAGPGLPLHREPQQLAKQPAAAVSLEGFQCGDMTSASVALERLRRRTTRATADPVA